MQTDYITLRGQSFRVEVNMAALKKFCNLKGIKDMRSFDTNALKSFEDAEAMIFYCLEQGAEIDQKPLPFTSAEVGSWVRIPAINKFMEVYKHQATAVETAPEAKKKRVPFWRIFRR